MATAAIRYLSIAEFLQIDFGPELKAELDNGVVRMMAGGSREHNRIQANLLAWFRTQLRGSGCRPYGSDAQVQTTEASIRFPDMTLDCGPDEGAEAEARAGLLDNPILVVEVLSPSTRAIDECVKLSEYRQMDGLEAILYVDPVAERVRLLEREDGSWRWIDRRLSEPSDVVLRAFGLTLPHTEIFARD